MAILAVLASAVIPMAEISATRSKELELRRGLRNIRTAIRANKDDFDRAVAKKKIIPAITETGYPKELEELVEGNDWKGLYPYKRKYLRRIPQDPFDEFDEGWERDLIEMILIQPSRAVKIFTMCFHKARAMR